MKKSSFLLFLLMCCLLVSCGGRGKITIFEIGQPREEVINTIVSDFIVYGEHLTKEEVLERENSQVKDLSKWSENPTQEELLYAESGWRDITIYNFEYKGQDYSRVTVNMEEKKVTFFSLKIFKNKIDNLLQRLESETGVSSLKLDDALYCYNANVFVTKNYAIMVVDGEHGLDTEKDENYYTILVCSGGCRDDLEKLIYK